MARFHCLLAIALAFSQASLKAQPTCPEPKPADFEKQVLMSGNQLNQPIEMAVARDGKVFVAERFGNIQYYDPATGGVSTAATFDTYCHTGQYDVGGILGVAVSPDFPARDEWVYIYWAPKSLWNNVATQTGGKLTYRLGRYRFLAGKIDISSEQILFDIPVEWETHNGGSLRFGKDGDLYLSTGDNSCAGCNNQYSPMDERAGYKHADDQRSTANTNDLRGKILRIKPLASPVDGKHYAIPSGNLKEKYQAIWTSAELAKVRPEIYTMGHRNPYRVHPDPVTGRLFIAEFGPAAQDASERGPAGADEISITDSAAFLGYPYFLKDNQAYCHWDYAQSKCVPIKGQSGMNYVAAKPINTSPNNTGAELLPPARPAVLWEHDGPTADPISGLKACGFGGGPVYRFDAASTSAVRFPPWFDGKWIIFGIYGGWQPKLAIIPPGPVQPIRQVVNAPFTSSAIQFTGGLHDMEFGADGALYALDYGQQMYANNGSDGLVRIVYKGRMPTPAECPTVKAAQPLPRAAKPGSGLIPASMRSLAAPEGAVRAEVFDLEGRLVFAGRPDPGTRAVNLPPFGASGLLQVRWVKEAP